MVIDCGLIPNHSSKLRPDKKCRTENPYILIGLHKDAGYCSFNRNISLITDMHMEIRNVIELENFY